MKNVITTGLSLCLSLALSACGAFAADAPPALQTAAKLAEQSGAPGGICVVLGAADAELPLALAKQGSFVVHCLAGDDAGRDALRGAIRARGAYGTVSAATGGGGRLPYADNLVNLVIVCDWPAARKQGLAPGEILRVLAPLGSAFVRESPAARADLRAGGFPTVAKVAAGGAWLHARKAWPEAIDEWTHYLHAADGNPVANDRVVAPPRRFQWLAGPAWMRSHESVASVSTMVTARGRLFYITDEAPISASGQHDLPDKWCLAARDAFNGVPLWKVPIRRWGWREWKTSWFSPRPGDVPLNLQKRLVAAGDKVYVTLGYHGPVSQLDARTGEILQTYEGTNPTGEILYRDGTLLLSLLVDDRIKIQALDAKTGKRLWISDKAYRGSLVDYYKWTAMRGRIKPAKLDASVNMAADGDAVALIDGPDVVCLDAKTGAQRWRTKFPSDPADLSAGGIRNKGDLWIGTMIVADGVVLHASPYKLAALDAKTGKTLWSQPKRYIGHLWYEWKDVFVIDHLAWTWGADLERSKLSRGNRPQASLYPRTVKGYDLRTGEVKRDVDLGYIFKANHHHRCYRDKATVRFILASRRGTEFVDLSGGPHTVHNWVRGICHLGMMPANGLQYVPPHPCACYIDEKLGGMLALAPAAAKADKAPPAPGPRLEKGPAYAANPPSAIRNPQSDDWPAFRHDALRTGSGSAKVPDTAKQVWSVRAGRKVSAPIVVGDRIFVALVDEYHVACLDAADGKTLWTRAAGSRIDSPPTWHNGTILFGSSDGWVYCARADDGALAWRFRAAPREKLIGADGRLESPWPVHGSVLVQDGEVYFAAGRTSQLDGGLTLFALDAATGKLIHQTQIEGPDYATDASGNLVVTRGELPPADQGKTLGENYNLPMGALPDVLLSDGEKIYMRSRTFDTSLQPARGKPDLTPKSGFLDDSYFKRTPWTYAGKDYARLIVHDNRSVYYVRMFDSLAGLDPKVYFTPASKGYLLFAKNVGGKKERWSGRVPVRIRAMVLTGGRLFVAGPPDVMDADDPLGAFEGRKGGLLYVVDAATGEKLIEHKLASPPVFNGAAAARGRLVLTCEDGSVTCFAAP